MHVPRWCPNFGSCRSPRTNQKISEYGQTGLDIHEALKNLGIGVESLDRIRLSRGIVGRATFVAIGGLVVLGLAIWKLNNPNAILLVAGAALLVFLVFFFGILLFASRNPGIALLEGAELLRWKQYELAAKNIPTPPVMPSIPDPTAPRAPMLPEEIEEPEQ